MRESAKRFACATFVNRVSLTRAHSPTFVCVRVGSVCELCAMGMVSAPSETPFRTGGQITIHTRDITVRTNDVCLLERSMLVQNHAHLREKRKFRRPRNSRARGEHVVLTEPVEID